MTQAFLGLLRDARQMRLDSLIASCAAGGVHEISVQHYGALDVFDLLINELTNAADDDHA